MAQPDLIVSTNLKRLREGRNMSYTQLSDLTGVSKSMLRQIEIGESSPTINTLWKIANGLEIPFGMLLAPTVPKFSQIAFKDISPILGKTEGYRLHPLITFDATRSFELYYVEIDSGVSLDADPHSGNAEETVLVTQGTLEIKVKNEMLVVDPQEMLRFDATYPHHYHNPTDDVVSAFMIISYMP